MNAQATAHITDLRAKEEFANSRKILKMAHCMKQLLGIKANPTHLELDHLLIEKVATTNFNKFEVVVRTRKPIR